MRRASIRATAGAARSQLGNGTDLVIGGTGDDTITVGNGSDIIVGNNGNVSFTTLGVLTTVQSSDPSAGGSNGVSAGYGNDFIIGGVGSNTISIAATPPSLVAAAAG